MSKTVLEVLREKLGDRVLETSSFRGDDEAIVAPADWQAAAKLLRDDPALNMDHFIDLTAVDYPEREPELPRFDVVVLARSLAKKHRIRLKTRVRVDQPLATLINVWQGADWTEREVWDMFGVRFEGHPDLRRILLYEEFKGHPLRKDYPIGKTQPLVEYRDVGPSKLAPFGDDMGNPFGRIDWLQRLGGGNHQVAPAIGLQQGQRESLSSGTDEPSGPKS
jgi:NADH-quinone oxidoreductase subunit C